MNKVRTEVAVGLFVVIGFLILSLFVFFISGIYFFRPGYRLRAVFDYVGIINQGAPVRFSGVIVGEVSKVTIVPAKSENEKARVEVTFFVEKGVMIRESDEISIQGNHIMSEPHIAITPRSGTGRLLKEGDLVEGVSPISTDDLIKQGESITKRLNAILEAIGGPLDDPEAQKTLRNSLENMNQILASMKTIVSGQENEFRTMVINLNRFSTQMDQLLTRVNQGQGTLGKLVTDDEVYNDLRDFVRDIKSHPWRLLKKG